MRLVDPISSKKRQLNKWALVSHCHFTFCQWIHTCLEYCLYKLLELQCNWKVENHIHAGALKRNYVLYTIYPPKNNYLCFLTLLNAWGLVTGTAVLPNEKSLSFKTEVYLLLSMFSENCLWSDRKDFLLRPYAATERKPTVSLADLGRCCPLTQGHSGLFHFLVIFISRFVKTGTPTPLSSNIRSDPSPQKKLNATVLCSNFLSNNSGILPILPSSESLR